MRKEYDFSRGKRGPVVKSPGKTRITIMIDDDVIEGYRAKAEAASEFPGCSPHRRRFPCF
jgi:hypothetical protein